jgi:putative ABC transport system ATP-binding protein
MSTHASQNTIQVRLKQLTRTFTEGLQKHLVLDNVSANFVQGHSVAIRGRSGSGKSTLLNLISGIDTPDSGQVEVAGLNLTAMNERERTLFRREHIGFIYQSFNLLPTLTVADNLRLVLELNAVSREESEQRTLDLLDAVGLADRMGSYPDILSGGERQRVAIARALCHQPSLILADEPTGNLDDRTAQDVLDLLDKLVRQAGRTMIVATHRASVADYCDQVLELHDGRLGPAQAGHP